LKVGPHDETHRNQPEWIATFREGTGAKLHGLRGYRPLFDASEHTHATGGLVTFEPGARTAWHTHPAGQTLIVTSGTGWVQESGGERRQIQPGDVIWIPPNVKHWHGATTTNRMSHIAITNVVDGRNVDWLEQVSDVEYAGQPGG